MRSRPGTPRRRGEAERCGGTERRAEEARATLSPLPLSPPPSPPLSGRPLQHRPRAPGSRPAGPAGGSWSWALQGRGQLWRGQGRDGDGRLNGLGLKVIGVH